MTSLIINIINWNAYFYIVGKLIFQMVKIILFYLLQFSRTKTTKAHNYFCQIHSPNDDDSILIVSEIIKVKHYNNILEQYKRRTMFQLYVYWITLKYAHKLIYLQWTYIVQLYKYLFCRHISSSLRYWLLDISRERHPKKISESIDLFILKTILR